MDGGRPRRRLRPVVRWRARRTRGDPRVDEDQAVRLRGTSTRWPAGSAGARATQMVVGLEAVPGSRGAMLARVRGAARQARTGYACTMTISTTDPLAQHADAGFARPLPAPIAAGRRDLLVAVRGLRTITDADLTRPWPWKGGSEEEVRYGFYRIGESFELAGIEAAAQPRTAGIERGRAADRIAPATAARWDLQGLLIDAPRLRLGRRSRQRGMDDPPDHGSHHREPALLRGRDRVVAEAGVRRRRPGAAGHDPGIRLRGPAQRGGRGRPGRRPRFATGSTTWSTAPVRPSLACRLTGSRLGARWSGFAIDIDYRLGRWSSHIREHTVQVEKTLVMIDHHPTEVDRLVRLLLAAWGRAEAELYGATDADEAATVLATAAATARVTATDVIEHARG